MNSRSASAPPIKASKFLLAFLLPSFDLKINNLNIFSLGFHLIFKRKHCQLLAIFVYFSQLITPKLRQTIYFPKIFLY